jgi:diguanylate cyclase (GGDEF)-like protein
MGSSPPPRILILARQPQTGRRWAGWLKDSAADVWLSAGDVPPGIEVDVLVTDLESIGSAADQLGPGADASAVQAPAGAGIISIGPSDLADVRLSEDCTARELSLACTLLAEVARLRQQRAKIAKVHQEISQLAYTDPLTGLANRRAWDLQLAAKVGLAQSARQRLWLAIVDLDRFKQINDARGLLAGDQALAQAARAMAAALRHDDFIARLGGDEFGVLLCGIDEPSARGVYERMRAALARQLLEPGAARLTASIGYAALQTGDRSAADLFSAAERALRQAKLAGGDRAVHGDL